MKATGRCGQLSDAYCLASGRRNWGPCARNQGEDLPPLEAMFFGFKGAPLVKAGGAPPWADFCRGMPQWDSRVSCGDDYEGVAAADGASEMASFGGTEDPTVGGCTITWL